MAAVIGHSARAGQAAVVVRARWRHSGASLAAPRHSACFQMEARDGPNEWEPVVTRPARTMCLAARVAVSPAVTRPAAPRLGCRTIGASRLRSELGPHRPGPREQR
jgi:hypothetical protein